MMRWEYSWASDVLTAFAPSAEPRTSSGVQPPSGGLAPREGEVDFLRAFDRLHDGSTPLAGFGLRFALWMVALAPIWFLGRFATFSTLARPERTELLSRLLRHTNLVVRELALLLKLTAAFALLGTPSVRERSGYDKPQTAASVARETGRRVLPLYATVATRDLSEAAPAAVCAQPATPIPSDRVAS